MNISVDCNAPAVKLCNLSLAFSPAVQVLNNVDLTISPNECIALVGRSGSGKTSLLAIISGLLRPSSGKVEVFGQDLSVLNQDALTELRRRKIGVVFQHFYLLETMTALENTALPLELAACADAKERAREMLVGVGMEKRLAHFPAQLSGGEQQRVAIARAFVSHPPLLLADEPTGNLDDQTSEQVLATLFSLANEYRTTMLFVTHNTAILDRFNQVLCIKDGKIITAEA